MSKYTENLYTIHNNIFVLTPLFIEFYSNLQVTPKNILLSYLVLPLVLYEQSQQKIKTSNSRSSIHSFLNSKEKDKRENVYGLPERVEEYKAITNQCLQYALDNNWIEIDKDLRVNVIEKQSNKIPNLQDAFIASKKLCNIFQDLDVVTIYKALGVKQL